MTTELVTVRDNQTGKTFKMPASELAPGMIRTIITNDDGEVVGDDVWRDARGIKDAPLRHQPFDESFLVYLRAIKAALDEVYPKTLEKWEDGFRRDTNPEREIGIWLGIAGAYKHFTDGRINNHERRREVFNFLLVASMNGVDKVFQTVSFRFLSRKKVSAMIQELKSANIRPIMVDGTEDGD